MQPVAIASHWKRAVPDQSQRLWMRAWVRNALVGAVLLGMCASWVIMSETLTTIQVSCACS